ncbi:hypothetical protein KW784_01300 [Candidatus Parcubacteria bacterium]|nr:hypothetical protein [Candidatus Parcubacteria bacterium]
MNFKSKKTGLLILGITSLVCSRAFFAFLNDPEGPNLLIVVVLAAVVYLLSVAAYSFGPVSTGFKRLMLAIFVQILLVSGLSFFLK